MSSSFSSVKSDVVVKLNKSHSGDVLMEFDIFNEGVVKSDQKSKSSLAHAL